MAIRHNNLASLRHAVTTRFATRTTRGWVGNLETTVGRQFDWDVMPTPKSPRTGKATPIITDRPNGVTKRTGRMGDQMDASWLFTNFMSGPGVMGIVAEGRTSIPTHTAALNSARFLRKAPEGIGNLQKLVSAAGFRLGLGKWGEWRTAVRTEIAKARTGEVAPDTALRTATQVRDAALQRLALP